ncbi:MAG: agmatine deiminase family protein [Peptococcaceae bacterium]|nr:agmatine deiminase family protein [Peptococcaceae bacterium]
MIPKDMNYQMPAEWHPHKCTFISWPVRKSMIYPENYKNICRGYAAIIETIAGYEPVKVIINPTDKEEVQSFLSSELLWQRQIELLCIEHNDAWLRDNGPTFVINDQGKLAGINWRFNAWGGKYAPWDLDDQVAPAILKHLGLKCFDAPLVLEGGSIHVDGEGTLLTTEQCLLNPNRNRGLTKKDIEKILGDYLNIEKVIWLRNGLYGDETDGHIDNIACFAAPGKILLQICDDPTDENYNITRENLAILKQEYDAAGRKPEIITVKLPPPMDFRGRRLTLSYLNFYLVNGGLILPVFGGEASTTDKQAIEIIKQVFPRRQIRPIDGMAIISEGGNVHCITQQMPVGIGGENNAKS